MKLKDNRPGGFLIQGEIAEIWGTKDEGIHITLDTGYEIYLETYEVDQIIDHLRETEKEEDIKHGDATD